MKIGSATVPNQCPVRCPQKMKWELCDVCPVLSKDTDNYREDWAIEFEKWFKNGMVGLPQLKE